jgi:Lipoprotein LpqB beta-propeller domain
VRRMLPALLLAATALAGCGGVPTSGEVRSGNEQAAPANQPGVVQYKPGPPRALADREAIVTGFLEAVTDPANAEIARMYLTKAAASSWRPSARTYVYDASAYGKPREATDSTVVLEAKWVGTLDRRGSWQPPDRAILKHAFQLVPEGKEWRIANPPAGTMVNQDQLTLIYGHYNLYFFNEAMDQLVPDPVYLPRTGTVGQVTNRLTESLLQGPTGRLGANVVKTAAPANSRFSVSVPSQAGVASVELDDTVARLAATDREQLAAQLTWTLRPVVPEVRLTAGGVPLVDGGDEVRSVAEFARYDPMVATKQLYVASDDDICRVSLSDGVARLESPVRGKVAGYGTRTFAVDLDSVPTVAAVGRDTLVVGDLAEPNEQQEDQEQKQPYQIPLEGQKLRPSFDKGGNLWVVDRAEQQKPRIQFITPDEAPADKPAQREAYEVEAPELTGKQVSAIRVAPDGVRVLLVTRSGGRSTVYIAGAVRNGDVVSLRLGRPVPVPLTHITDAGWSAADKFMVLGNNGTGPNQVREVSVDGSTNPQQGLGQPASYNPVFLATAPSNDALLAVGDEPGVIRIRGSDFSWRDSLKLEPIDPKGPKLHDPVYPG